MGGLRNTSTFAGTQTSISSCISSGEVARSVGRQLTASQPRPEMAMSAVCLPWVRVSLTFFRSWSGPSAAADSGSLGGVRTSALCSAACQTLP